MSSYKDWYSNNIAVAVMMSPAAYTTEKYVASIYTKSHWNCMKNNNIWVFGGPDWVNQRKVLKNTCNFSDDDLGNLDVLPNNPIQVIAHYAQNASQGRFQTYIDTDTWFNLGNTWSKSYDYTQVTGMKVALLSGLWDDTVPMAETVAMANAFDKIGSLIEFDVAPW